MTDINQAAEAMTGEWVKLTRKEHGTVEGRVVSFEQRPMTFEGAPVLNRKTGAATHRMGVRRAHRRRRHRQVLASRSRASGPSPKRSRRPATRGQER